MYYYYIFFKLYILLLLQKKRIGTGTVTTRAGKIGSVYLKPPHTTPAERFRARNFFFNPGLLHVASVQ